MRLLPAFVFEFLANTSAISRFPSPDCNCTKEVGGLDSKKHVASLLIVSWIESTLCGGNVYERSKYSKAYRAFTFNFVGGWRVEGPRRCQSTQSTSLGRVKVDTVWGSSVSNGTPEYWNLSLPIWLFRATDLDWRSLLLASLFFDIVNFD